MPRNTGGPFRGIAAGDVVVARLPQHAPSGREQEGSRPAVVVGLPEVLGVPRFPMVLVAPITSDRDGAARAAAQSPRLYPRFAKGTANLSKDSVCLLDQVRALDASRLEGYLGKLGDTDYGPVRDGLREMFGLALPAGVLERTP